ncbi:hypothetical protein SGQ44_16445 [Flavobacterium sp. Fl-77]|uniref:Uncharacterized protein n=1 Tax=Flavobacterium flavipigmentatum TaxID=2893884 RepID=A0AAJ2SDW2_9FLAO|nr:MULTISPECIES: hypothetical protein [unclassified Flavobacterium]MDX6183901.1 hypothetical protein [Flavobacterium sp. Fl-33]MDX6187354.1 hypothetical protein [Flavobacterium sp. Fl-77]UFH40258.1 hypothetical protein LNP22_08260 [Flavobacterium sp. F-70]
MSLTIKILKIIAIISFLMLPGLHENGVPHFGFLLFCLLQFITDLFSNSTSIFWQGFLVVPILVTLAIFFISKNYKILFFCFLILLISSMFTTGLIANYERINFLFLFVFLIFILSSIGVIALVKKRIVEK